MKTAYRENGALASCDLRKRNHFFLDIKTGFCIGSPNKKSSEEASRQASRK
jgi:hypothetical protein